MFLPRPRPGACCRHNDLAAPLPMPLDFGSPVGYEDDDCKIHVLLSD